MTDIFLFHFKIFVNFVSGKHILLKVIASGNITKDLMSLFLIMCDKGRAT